MIGIICLILWPLIWLVGYKAKRGTFHLAFIWVCIIFTIGIFLSFTGIAPFLF